MVVATGNYEGKFVTETGVIDLDNPSATCASWRNTDELIFATGGVFKDGLIICGGLYYTHNENISDIVIKKCQLVNQTDFSFLFDLRIASSGSAGVMINPETLLITGGTDGKCKKVRHSDFRTLS